MLAVGGIVLSRNGEKCCFGRKDRIENDHSSDSAVQAARSRRGNSISVHSMQDGRKRVVITLIEEDLQALSVRD